MIIYSQSCLEMSVATADVLSQLEGTHSLEVCRLYIGVYMSSLDMSGLSVSVLRVSDDEDLASLDERVVVSPFASVSTEPPQRQPFCRETPKVAGPVTHVSPDNKGARPHGPVHRVLTRVAQTLLSAETQLNQLDAVSGDADCGSTLVQGANGRLKQCADAIT